MEFWIGCVIMGILVGFVASLYLYAMYLAVKGIFEEKESNEKMEDNDEQDEQDEK